MQLGCSVNACITNACRAKPKIERFAVVYLLVLCGVYPEPKCNSKILR